MAASESKQRNFGLSPEDVKELQAEHAETKRVPNPYRTGGYKFTVAALIALGADKPHPLPKVYKAFREAAGDEWFEKWASKSPRNAETGKDAEGRFMQNILTLQRTADYGLRLHQVGTKVLKTKGVVIDLLREGDE